MTSALHDALTRRPIARAWSTSWARSLFRRPLPVGCTRRATAELRQALAMGTSDLDPCAAIQGGRRDKGGVCA